MRALANNSASFYLGCLFLIFVPASIGAWILFQFRALGRSERLPLLLLGLLVAFSALPAFVLASTFPERRNLGAYDNFILFVSVCGLVLLPVTLIREFLKLRRDSARQRGKKRRKAGSEY